MNTRPEKRWDVRGFFSTKHVRDPAYQSDLQKKRAWDAGRLAVHPAVLLPVPNNAVARDSDGNMLPADFLDSYRVSQRGDEVVYNHIDGSPLPEGITVTHYHPLDFDDNGALREGAKEHEDFNPLSGNPRDWGLV